MFQEGDDEDRYLLTLKYEMWLGRLKRIGSGITSGQRKRAAIGAELDQWHNIRLL